MQVAVEAAKTCLILTSEKLIQQKMFSYWEDQMKMIILDHNMGSIVCHKVSQWVVSCQGLMV